MLITELKLPNISLPNNCELLHEGSHFLYSFQRISTAYSKQIIHQKTEDMCQIQQVHTTRFSENIDHGDVDAQKRMKQI